MRINGLLAVIFLFFVFQTDAFSQYSRQEATDESRSVPVFVQEFSGGMVSHASALSIKENVAADAVNARFNEKHGSVAKRKEMRLYGSVGSTKVTGLHRYYKSNGDRYLIASGGTKLYVGDDETGDFYEAYSGLSDSKRFDFETYKDVAICANGTDRILKFDGNVNTGTDEGDRTDGYLMADLGAPFADLSGSGDLSATGWYQYKVLFKDEDGLYYYSDARSNPIQTGSSTTSVDLSGIPIGKDGVTERQIYRTKANDTTDDLFDDDSFYYVGTLSDNSTLVYNDALNDLSLSIALSITGHINATPPTGKYLEIHAERLFISGNQQYKSDFYWSDLFNPDFYLPTQFEQARPDDGDEITFIDTILGILAIGKRNSIQKFYASGDESTWTLSGVYSTLGCVAPYSEVSTAIGLIYLGRHGLYRFDGQSSYLLSDNVTDKIRDISQTDIGECFGVYWNNEYHLAYASESSGEAQNNRVLVYDLIRNNFTLDYKDVNCMATLESGLDYGLLYFGSSVSDGKVLSDGSTVTMIIKKYKSQMDTGTYDDTRSFGTEVDPYIELAWDVTGLNCNLTNSYPLAGDMTSGTGLWLGERPNVRGSWTSPVYSVGATNVKKLYWNESTESGTDVTARIRTALTEGGVLTASWSQNFTDPTGSDISAVTSGDFLQLAFDLSTTDITKTPSIFHENQYVFKLTYEKAGVLGESNVSMLWESGWRYLGTASYRVQIKRIRVFYDGENGEFTVNYYNDDRQSDGFFTVDLDQSESTTENLGADFYRAGSELKSFTHYPNNAFGDTWKIEITDSNSGSYRIDRIEVVIWHDEYLDF